MFFFNFITFYFEIFSLLYGRMKCIRNRLASFVPQIRAVGVSHRTAGLGPLRGTPAYKILCLTTTRYYRVLHNLSRRVPEFVVPRFIFVLSWNIKFLSILCAGVGYELSTGMQIPVQSG